jgi:hypothetical protein
LKEHIFSSINVPARLVHDTVIATDSRRLHHRHHNHRHRTFGIITRSQCRVSFFVPTAIGISMTKFDIV